MSIWISFIGSIVRWALAALFGGLVVRGIIDERTLNSVVGQGASMITAGILGLVVPLLWSFWQKIQQKVKVLVALDTPSTGTAASVEKKTGEIPFPQKISAALSTADHVDTANL